LPDTPTPGTQWRLRQYAFGTPNATGNQPQRKKAGFPAFFLLHRSLDITSLVLALRRDETHAIALILEGTERLPPAVLALLNCRRDYWRDRECLIRAKRNCGAHWRSPSDDVDN